MAYTKALLLFGLLSVMLLISFEVSARLVVESTTNISETKPAAQSNGFKWDDDLHKCKKSKGHDHSQQSGHEHGSYGHGGYQGQITPNHKKDKDHDCGKGGSDDIYGQFNSDGGYGYSGHGKGGDN